MATALLLALLLCVVVPVVLALALLRSESGSRWLLRHAPGLEVTHSEGALLADRFTAQGVSMKAGSGGWTLTINRLSWRGARWSWSPPGSAWLGLKVDELAIGETRLSSGTKPASRVTPPGSLRLPVQIDIAQISVESLQVDGQEPAREILAQLSLGRDRGAQHHIELRQLQWHQMGLQGQAHLGSDSPFPVDVQLQAKSSEGTPWQAQAQLQGPLSSADLKLRLSGEANDKRPVPALDMRAQLRPFEISPLGNVDLTTRALDLSVLLPGAPRTMLNGHALVRSQGLRQPVSADIQLDNAAPGRFSEGGLPVLALRMTLRANPQQADSVQIGPFELETADSRGGAGRWSGSGSWTGDSLQLQTRLLDFQPARLDGRLPTMQISGPLNVSAQGLPAVDASAKPKPWPGWSALKFQGDGELLGRIEGAPDKVRLVFSAEGARRSLQIKQLQAESGSAKAQLSASVSEATPQRWQVRSEGELKSFDPRVWFPGSEATWGRGAHLLNGNWSVDVTAPQRLLATEWAQWLPLLLGHADLKLSESRWAGLPLAAELALRQDTRADAAAARSRARADIRLADARLQVTGSGDASGEGTNDRTDVKLNVPDLGGLAALAATWPALQAWSPRRGELQLQADFTGRWPALTGEVQASGSRVAVGPLALGRAHVQGRFDARSAEALSLRVEADEMGWQQARFDRFRGSLQGSLASHRFDLELTAPLQPPAELAQIMAWRTTGKASAQVAGTGSWTGDAGGGLAGRWNGQAERVKLAPVELAAAAPTAQAQTTGGSFWLDAEGLRGEVQLDARGGLKAAALQPGKARSGPIALRWTDAQWQEQPGAPASWRFLGEVETLPMVPLLQRALGPRGLGPQWSGDLRANARIDLRADSRFLADVVLQREGGDLTTVEAGVVQPLGIELAELRLQARDGIWRIQPQLQGKSLGLIGGEFLVRAQLVDRWPAPASPVEGTVQARINSLSAWSNWLPAGWRLQGEAEAAARLSGTWGAPAFTGSLSGQKVAIRNLLQGVDLQEGSLRVLLEGETARIETLSIRGGTGWLTADGLARWGASPSLQLNAKADKLRVLGRVDRQLVLSGQSRLNLAAEQLKLEGSIVADSGLVDLTSRDAPGLDEDVSVKRGTEPDAASAARLEPSALMRQAQVAVDLDLGKNLRLRGRGLDTLLTGKLRLTAPRGRPAFQGTVQADGGTYAAYGQKLEIERGRVSFNGALDSARLDILALRPNLDLRVGVAITGSALDPRVRLVSEPEMAESDKLSWLVLGRGPEGLGTTDTALLQRAALALLAGDGESPADTALRAIGLDEFSIRQSEGEVRETVVTIGKQLSRRWFVGYERGVNATAGTWQLVYRAAQRFTLRAQSGNDNSVDMIWTWRFGAP